MTGCSGPIDRTLALSVWSRDSHHVSPLFEYCSSDLNGHLLTGRSAQTDRTLSLQRPVISNKVLEMDFFDRMCLVMHDRTLPASGHAVTFLCAARQHDQTLDLSVRSVQDLASGRLTDTGIFAATLDRTRWIL